MSDSEAPLKRRARRGERAELLLPAGDLPRLKTAILYGADAVYAGTPDLSLRTKSEMSLEDLAIGIRYAHERGKRVYLTLNLFAHNRDVPRLEQYLETFRELRPDGVIVADLGIFEYLREHAPELELHVSTQANVLSWLSVQAWQRLGADLCVLAREVSFAELQEIRERCPDMKLETFVHGAMCMTYSGRCLLSNYMAERGSNQGSCAHSCRWKYSLLVKHKDGTEGTIDITDQNMGEFEFFLEEEFRKGVLYPIEEDERGSYILNAKDLCLMPELDKYLALGVDSLKVEGRNKSEYYVAVVGRAYRAAMDAYYDDPENFRVEPFLAELETVPSRGYTKGFFEGRLDGSAQSYGSSQSLSAFEYGGLVTEANDTGLVVEVKNRLLSGDVLEFLPPNLLEVVRLRLYEFWSRELGHSVEKVTAGEGRSIVISWDAFHQEDRAALRRMLIPGVVVRKARALTDEQSEKWSEHRASFASERGLISSDRLTQSRASLRAQKPPKLGAEGCCGLGCNGCLPFWHDARFERARTVLRRKAGERLMAAELPLEAGE